MNRFFPKRPRFRLDPVAYRRLRHRVLERDGWRCQRCGSLCELEVHHIRSRGLLGDDAAENLITLCARCHQEVHLLGSNPTNSPYLAP